ncbi:MAG TPA: CoA pyrophosphatase [Candidatus Acidoferrales bacterium]|nr:CoA pyrophosphatase [Candidatus Acidoferrales bacterium]
MKVNELDSLIEKLPESPRFEGEEEYSISAVLLLLITINEELHILFEKRSAAIRQGGEISLPGGRLDANDRAFEETAIRETTEEVGIPADRIRIIGKLDSVFAPMGALVHVFVAVSDVRPDDIQANPGEVEKTFLIPVSFFQKNQPEEFKVMTEVHPAYIDKTTKKEVVLFPTKELGLPERYWNSWGGFKHNIFVYRTDEGTIWGITARIVRDFIRKL